ncbi:ATP-grasp domain-containing protein [Streptomyces pseudogriseolus]|uniref:ATP-grasp domain-containing protein n=1 Tax=Streptomyces pseudogriseolus TaxID=36817 RepID=UPI003FA3348A
MAHLLMVESWVGSMSRLLPRAIQEAGHTFTFLTRDLHHYLRTAPEGAAHPLLGARDVVTADTNDPESLLPYVERLHEVLGFDGVLTSCDYYLPTAALLAERLGLTAPDPEAVRNACRKDATRRVLEKAGVPGPRFAVHEDRAELGAAARDIGYPLVVKPVDLCAGMFVRRVDDDGQLAAAVRALGDFPVNARGQRRAPAVLLEELLDGPEVSVETVSHAGAVAVVGVTDKSVGGAPAFIETGHMFPAALSDAETEDVVRTAVDALTALGLTDGVVAHTEIKLTSAGPRVVEVNPRPAGNRITELVRRVTGVDLVAAFVDVSLGRAPDLRRTDTGLRSAAVGFLVPEATGTLAALDGSGLRTAPDVLEAELAEPGRQVRAAGSNNEYLGHVMVGDTEGAGARERVEGLLASLRSGLVIR